MLRKIRDVTKDSLLQNGPTPSFYGPTGYGQTGYAAQSHGQSRYLAPAMDLLDTRRLELHQMGQIGLDHPLTIVATAQS